jgi:hypothetical protein
MYVKHIPFITMYISPSLSFIMDPYDKTYVQQKVFTQSELQEIKQYNQVRMKDLPMDIARYLRLFGDCVSGIYGSVDGRYGCLTLYNSAAHH